MHKIIFSILLLLPVFVAAQGFTTRFEESNGMESGTYFETVDWWTRLSASSKNVQMLEVGSTDAGFPLHLILVSADRDFDIASAKGKGKVVVLVNNGIHPGEPEGIDASKLLVRDIRDEKLLLPENVLLAIIPVYNVGGALNRSKNYRIDQNGPKEKGFRGNAQNLDLNRDFIKADSRNAFSFAKVFHFLDPDIFIDNHASNGADYQHVMTLLTSQHNKLGGEMGVFLNQTFEPAIYELMKSRGYDLVPYVNHFGESPEDGWTEFWDSPRYSSGYATLWNSFAFVPETHMLKPYRQRVDATKALMASFIKFASQNSKEIIRLRKQAKQEQKTQSHFPLAWKIDKSKFATITYRGFEAGRKKSSVSGLSRLYYDRSRPFDTRVPFYNYYVETLAVERPEAYIIPQGWWKVIERLAANKVKMRRLEKDTLTEVEYYRIDDYKSTARPFEGHHVNFGVKISKHKSVKHFRKGDYFIPMNQVANRFLMETLEPQAEDSYFAWNFFDAVLGQKEGFSDYHFEDVAAKYLEEHPDVRNALEKKAVTDTAFAKSARDQLNFVFTHSPYLEPAYLEYPVYRLLK